jgi:chloramphenicol 3-O-phosphotransferase
MVERPARASVVCLDGAVLGTAVARENISIVTSLGYGSAISADDFTNRERSIIAESALAVDAVELQMVGLVACQADDSVLEVVGAGAALI